jgi:hypothetical protein
MLLAALISFAMASAAADAPAAVTQDPPPANCDKRPDCRFAKSVDLKMPNGGVWHLKADQPLEIMTGKGDDRAVGLLPGESVVVRLDDHGQPNAVILSHGRAEDVPPSKLSVNADDQVKAMAASKHPPQEGVAPGTVMAPEAVTEADLKPSDLPLTAPLEKDTIRLTFKQVPGTTWMILFVENGYDKKLQYKARMLKMGDTIEPTDVCEVMSGKPSFENWPYPFAEIMISDLRLVDGDPDNVACQ